MQTLPTAFFLRQRVKCPVCREEFSGQEINPRLYAAAEREDDRHVLAYNWAQGIVTDIKPHHYGVWHCHVCHFCALQGEFSLAAPTVRDQARWSTYRQLPPAVQMKMRQLTAPLLMDPPWDETTVTLLIAQALWIHTLVEEENRSWMDLGKLYLKLAWMYRENPVITLRTEETKAVVTLGQSDMQKAFGSFSTSLTGLEASMELLNSAIDRRHRELGRDMYASIIESIRQKIHALVLPTRNLEQVLLRDLQHGSGVGEGHAAARPPLAGLVHFISALWPQFPTSEDQATHACVDAFDRGLRMGDGGDLSVSAQLNLITMNIRLLSRIGDFRHGLQYITDMSKMAYNERQDLNHRLREMEKQKKGQDQLRPLVRQLNSVSAVLQNLSTLRDQLAASLLEKEGDEGRQFLEEKGLIQSSSGV